MSRLATIGRAQGIGNNRSHRLAEASGDRRSAGLIVVGAYAGLLVGASIGLAVAAGRLALPPLLAVAGGGIGIAVGLMLGAVGRARGVGGPADPPSQALAEAPPPPGDGSPGWYADPFGSLSARLWDGRQWTPHRWHRGA